MSFKQSRSDKSEQQQYRKLGRSASSNQQQRTSSGVYGKGAGGGPAPSSSLSSSSSSSRSFKKSNNAQGGQPRVHTPAVNSTESSNASAARNIQTGARVQPQLQGASNTLVASGVAKPVGSPANQRSTQAVPKAPTSRSATLSSDSSFSTHPTKGDASQAFSLQFGSISPGSMNGMQIPGQTSSAPPNLDEQKRDQACHGSSVKSVSNLPTTVPRQQLPRKDSVATGQSNSGEAHSMPMVKKDVQASAGHPVNQTQKSSHLNIPMASMQMPFHHQPQVPMQFGVTNPQIQSQSPSVSATSIQMPVRMPIPMENDPQVLQQQLLVPGLSPHPLPLQGMMHQGQGLSFTPPLGGQLAPQLGNLGMGIAPQSPQQQGGKFSVPQKTTVKITHPETREELRLNKRTDTYLDSESSGPRSHPIVPSQFQPVPSFAPHSINYYSDPYNTNSIFYPPPNTLQLSSSQIAVAPNAQGLRFNYPVGQSHQNISYMNSAAAHGSLPVNKSVNLKHGTLESPRVELACDVHNVASSASSGITQVTVKPAIVYAGEKVTDSSLSINLPPVEKVGSLKPSVPSSDGSLSQAQRDLDTCQESSVQQPKCESESLASNSLPATAKRVQATNLDEFVSSAPAAMSGESVRVVVSNDSGRDSLTYSNSVKDYQKKPGKEGHIQPPNQSMSTSYSASHTAEHSISADSAVSDTIRAKTALTSSSAAYVLPQHTKKLTSINGSSTSSIDLRTDRKREGLTSDSSEVSGTGSNVDCLDMVQHANIDGSSKLDEQLKPEINRIKDPLKSMELESDQNSALKASTTSDIVPTFVTARPMLDEDVGASIENKRVSDGMDFSTSKVSESTDLESSHVVITFGSNASAKAIDSNEVTVTKSGASDQQSTLVTTTDLFDSSSKYEGGGVPVPSSKDKPAPDLSRTKSTSARWRKKRQEFLEKADAAGTTSDRYIAFKSPEEKKETVVPSASAESNCTGVDLKLVSHESPQVDSTGSEKLAQDKAQLDDWEDAADSCAPKLGSSNNGEKAHEGLINIEKDGNGNISKKYSRDFLLKFAEQCTDLPQGFEIASDIAEPLMTPNVNGSHLVDRDSYPSPGRKMDRQSSGSRFDRRGSGMVDNERWVKLPGSFRPGRDMHLDPSYGAATSFQPVQGGIVRHPRAQTLLPFAGGILAGPKHPMGLQGGMPRNSPDTDRWQPVANYSQKGLISSLQTPLQMMHRAARKYEMGKVTDEETLKQRQLKAILNKLTPQNFEKLFEQVKAVNIDNAVTLTGVISQIFDKALMEPTFCEMYANFCYHLAGELPDFSEGNEKITFKRLLLNKCQEEFERGEREQEEANKVEVGEAKRSEEEREEKRIKARRRMLGNIRLIGEVYKKKMLTEKIMHECIKKLLGEYENPDEEDIEALCKLMSTIGEMIDHPKAKVYMDAYFERMAKLSNNVKLSSRVRFMLKDAIDLRKNKWQQRRKVDGPKKIEEVHRDAAQERQAQASRLAHGPGINPAARRAPSDFGPRASVLSSPGPQVGSFRGSPTQLRGFGAQDARMDDRLRIETRNLLVPLPQRPVGDDSIALGPQGGIARGMDFRGPPAMPSTPLADVSPISGDSRRLAAGSNGFSSLPERATYGSREEFMPRDMRERFAAPAAYDQLNSREPGMNFSNRDLRNPNRPLAASPARGQASGFTQNTPPERGWSEERLQEMSMATIREFYSARDEKEVALCIKELNSQSFHPTMIALWVTDSFERKDMERHLLAKLLVNLARSRDGVLSQDQLVKGFESVLSTLEDVVDDAPKAAEFLGHIFAKIIVENVVTLSEIGRLIYDGGEEPGRLLETGLAADVLGSTLGVINTEKGETVLNEIRASSCLRLEDFRPPHSNKSSILEKFI